MRVLRGFHPAPPPKIAPLGETGDRPSVSVMIPTYNCDDLFESTLRSVLNQDLGPNKMQIAVVDDGSRSRCHEEVVERLAPRRVELYRQESNLGLARTWNECIERARGHWVHILHQDDLVLPGFYQRLRQGIELEPDIGAAFCRDILMDEDGNWYAISPIQSRAPGIIPDWLERIASGQFIRTPSIVVKHDVYRKIGGYSPELVYTLDWDLWKRIAARYPVWHEPQPLACYRTHKSSETSRLIHAGADIADAKKSIEISRAYLPTEIADRVSAKAAECFSIEAVNNARRMLGLRNVSAALAQIRGALQLSLS